MVLSTTRPNGLSSTLRTRSPCTASEATPASEFELAAWEAFARLKVTVKVKVVPPPRRGATTISPPIARASAFTDDSPSPAPPKRDAMLTLACEKGRNRRLISLSVSPIPLSEIANETATLPLWPSIDSTASATPPASVNFTALSIRFSNAARRRTGSPITSAGSLSAISTWDCRPFAAARPASESPALRAMSAATREARFFGDRLFGGRVVRCERDFGAMIPLTLAAPTMPWPGWRSHAEGVSVCGVPTANPWQSRQADQATDVGRRRTSGAEFAQAGGLGRLREFPPCGIEDEAVVTVSRLRQAKP